MDRNRQIIETEIQRKMMQENTSRDKISTLRLDCYRLTKLPLGIFDGLTGVTDIRLDNNQIMDLPEDIFNDLRHIRIDLGHNPLKTIHISTKEFLEQNDHVKCYVHLGSELAQSTFIDKLFEDVKNIKNISLSSVMDLDSLEVVDYDDFNCKGALN